MANLLDEIMGGMDSMTQLQRLHHAAFEQQQPQAEAVEYDEVGQLYSNEPVHVPQITDEEAERRLQELVEHEEEVLAHGSTLSQIYQGSALTYSTTKPRTTPSYPVASYQIEAEAIRHLIVMQKMTEKGFNMDPSMFRKDPLLALSFVTEHQPNSFCPKPEQHVCTGGTDAHWKLASLKKLKTQFGAKSFRGGVAAWTEDWERHSRANQEGCSFSQLEAETPFYHLTDQKTYLATGDVFVCIMSGNVHVCTSELCRNQITLPREEGIECSLTHRNYGVPMVYVEERDRDGEGRDGGMSYTSTKSTGVQLRSKKKSSSKANGAGSVGAMEERLNASTDMTFSAVKRLAGHDHSYLYEYFKTAYPRVKYPVPSIAGVSLTSELCNALVYDSDVRRHVWDRLKSAEYEVQALIKQHYLERLAKKKYRDQGYVVEQLMRLKPYWDRLATIGFFDEEPDKSILVYLHDCVLTIWTLLHYMPFAQRSVTGLQLSPKQIVAILYKLQSGFYVSVTYDPVTKVILPSNSKVVPAPATQPLPQAAQSMVKTNLDQKKQLLKPSLSELSVEENLKVETNEFPEPFEFDLDALEKLNADDLFSDFEALAGVDPDQSLAVPAAAASSTPTPAAAPVTKLICFIPRHKFLQRMPQKSDLNNQRFPRFKKYNLDSNTVIKTDKLISDCYESLMNQKGVTVDRLHEFALERYINLREFP